MINQFDGFEKPWIQLVQMVQLVLLVQYQAGPTQRLNMQSVEKPMTTMAAETVEVAVDNFMNIRLEVAMCSRTNFERRLFGHRNSMATWVVTDCCPWLASLEYLKFRGAAPFTCSMWPGCSLYTSY